MFLYSELCAHAEATKPVQVGLIGAGKFGSMFLSQVPTTPGLIASAITDLDPRSAQQACAAIGWPQDLIEKLTSAMMRLK